MFPPFTNLNISCKRGRDCELDPLDEILVRVTGREEGLYRGMRETTLTLRDVLNDSHNTNFEYHSDPYFDEVLSGPLPDRLSIQNNDELENPRWEGEVRMEDVSDDGNRYSNECPTSITQHLIGMLEKPESCDVQLNFQSVNIPVHWLVLRRLPYFESVFQDRTSKASQLATPIAKASQLATPIDFTRTWNSGFEDESVPSKVVNMIYGQNPVFQLPGDITSLCGFLHICDYMGVHGVIMLNWASETRLPDVCQMFNTYEQLTGKRVEHGLNQSCKDKEWYAQCVDILTRVCTDPDATFQAEEVDLIFGDRLFSTLSLCIGEGRRLKLLLASKDTKVISRYIYQINLALITDTNSFEALRDLGISTSPIGGETFTTNYTVQTQVEFEELVAKFRGSTANSFQLLISTTSATPVDAIEVTIDRGVYTQIDSATIYANYLIPTWVLATAIKNHILLGEGYPKIRLKFPETVNETLRAVRLDCSSFRSNTILDMMMLDPNVRIVGDLQLHEDTRIEGYW